MKPMTLPEWSKGSSHGRTNAQVQDALRGVKTLIGHASQTRTAFFDLMTLLAILRLMEIFSSPTLARTHYLGRDRIGVLVVKAEEAAFGGEVLEDQIQDLSQHVVQVFAAHQGLGHLTEQANDSQAEVLDSMLLSGEGAFGREPQARLRTSGQGRNQCSAY